VFFFFDQNNLKYHYCPEIQLKLGM
jgi:hypothetical protein